MRRLWDNGPALLALCMLIWAGSVVTGRAAAGQVPPALFTAVRWCGALVLALPFGWTHLRRDWAALRARWWVAAVLGFLGVALYNSLVYRGLHDTTAVNALLLQSAAPLLILVMAFLLFGQRPGALEVVAILLSAAGVVVIAAQASWTELERLRFNPGDTLVLIAVVAYAAYSALLRLKPAVHPVSLLIATMVFGDVFLVPLAWAEYAAGGRLVVTVLSVSSLVYAVVGPAFVAYLVLQPRHRAAGGGAGGAIYPSDAGIRDRAGGAVPGRAAAPLPLDWDGADRGRAGAGGLVGAAAAGGGVGGGRAGFQASEEGSEEGGQAAGAGAQGAGLDGAANAGCGCGARDGGCGRA